MARISVILGQTNTVRVAADLANLPLTDYDKYGKQFDKSHNLDTTTIASCHCPRIEGPFIEMALARLRELPNLGLPDLAGQPVFDEIVAANAEAKTHTP